MLEPLKGFLELILSNEIDTEVKTTVIEQSDEARGAEKLMYGVNSVNQQVRSLHYQSDPQKDSAIKLLPDYPCIEFSVRMRDIRKWQRAVYKILAPFLKKKCAIEEIKKALEENMAAIQKVKRPRLKEFSA